METLKTVNEILIMVDIFSIFLHKLEIYCQDRFQKPSLQNNWNFAYKVKYFQKKNSR